MTALCCRITIHKRWNEKNFTQLILQLRLFSHHITLKPELTRCIIFKRVYSYPHYIIIILIRAFSCTVYIRKRCKPLVSLATYFWLLPVKPQTVKIVSSSEAMSAGMSKHLMCETEGSHPPATISWLLDGEPIKQAATMVKCFLRFILRFHLLVRWNTEYCSLTPLE